ncbi:transport protein particle component [Phyllosticta citricarpa]|uniref:Transport protein particle component n=1 Tax=Phyllosticta citricarpa TaxID=55181 RepID=A0ABR1ME97_9PEZI
MSYDGSATPFTATPTAANSTTAATVDPSASAYFNASCMDFLLIELVPMAYRMAAELAAREEEYLAAVPPSQIRSATSNGKGGMTSPGLVSSNGETGGAGKASVAGTATVASVDEEELRESALYRLDMLGYRVGLGICERFSRDKPRLTDTLDVIKFLCKDLWTMIFRKQIDNLKTNHRGIYVLTDNAFKPLSKMSLEKGEGEQSLSKAQPFLYFPAGLIRGALASMGIVATVTAETTGLPGATFQIRTQGAKS